MATPHNRVIEDQIMRCLADLWEVSGENRASIALKIGVSGVTLWQWHIGGMAFPNSLSRLRRLVEASGAKIEFKITSRGGDEFSF